MPQSQPQVEKRKISDFKAPETVDDLDFEVAELVSEFIPRRLGSKELMTKPQVAFFKYFFNQHEEEILGE